MGRSWPLPYIDFKRTEPQKHSNYLSGNRGAAMKSGSFGKKNIVFGIIYSIITISLSLFLTERGWVAEWVSTGTELHMLESALLYGNIDAVLNIFGGFLIGRLPLVDWLGKSISATMIAGTVLHSGMFYLAAFGFMPYALYVMTFGSLLLIGVMLLMGVAIFGIKAAK